MYWLKEALYWPTFWGRWSPYIHWSIHPRTLKIWIFGAPPQPPPKPPPSSCAGPHAEQMGGNNHPWKCTENLIFLGSRKKDWKFRWAETSSFYAYLTWWLLRFFFEDTLFLGTKNQTVFFCLNLKHTFVLIQDMQLDFSTPGVLVWKRWMLITTKRPKKSTLSRQTLADLACSDFIKLILTG